MIDTVDEIQPVKIPDEKGVHTKKCGKKSELYVYKNTRYYRTESGQARHDSVCIGKACPDDPTMMVPNERYYLIFNTPIPDSFWKAKSMKSKINGTVDKGVNNQTVVDSNITMDRFDSFFHYGYTFIVFMIATSIGLKEVLESCLGLDMALDIISIIAYMIQNGNSMIEMEHWQEFTFLPYEAAAFSSGRISSLFRSLNYSTRQSVMANWVSKNKTDDCICYDVTSISSYSENDIEIEYGYNRDHEQLPQINMGYFSSLQTRRPLTYSVYNGSLNDSSNLAYVIQSAADLGLSNFHFFADGGFFYEKCFNALKKFVKSFTIGMPLERNISKEYIDSISSDIHKSKHRIIGLHVQCIELDKVVYRTKGRVLIFYDQGKADDQNRSMDYEIDNLTAELKELKKMPRSTKYKKYFILKKHENDDGFDFELDLDKMDNIMKYHGYFLIFTTNKNFTCEEILHHYREKDVDEKMFYQIKDPMRGNRNRTHNLDTTNGKLFVTFLATVIRSEMYRLLKDYIKGHSLTLKIVIDKLANIAVVGGREGIHLVKEITKEQREILTVLGAVDKLRDSIEAMNHS